MNWLNIKRLMWALLFLFRFPVAAAAAEADSVWCWNKRTDWHYNGWERLKPRNFMAQYAGGMGFLSFGAGWEYGRSGQWNTDLLVGFIPKEYADKFRFTFTAKQTYTPWHWHFKPQFSLEPLICGVYINTIGGDRFWEREPAKYPNGYYTFSTKLRFNIFIGQSITFYPRSDIFRAVKLFYELSTNDLYVVSKATNSTLRFGDILRLSFGVKFQIYHPHTPKRQ